MRSILLSALLGWTFMLFGQSTPFFTVEHGGYVPDILALSVENIVLDNGNFVLLANQTAPDDTDVDIYLYEIDPASAQVVNTRIIDLPADQFGTEIFRSEDGNVWVVGTTVNLGPENFQDVLILELNQSDLTVVNNFTLNQNRYENIEDAVQTGPEAISIVRNSRNTFFGGPDYSVISVSMQNGSVISEATIENPMFATNSLYLITGETGEAALVFTNDIEAQIDGIDLVNGTVTFSQFLPPLQCSSGSQSNVQSRYGQYNPLNQTYVLATACDALYEVDRADGSLTGQLITNSPQNLNLSRRSYFFRAGIGFFIYSGDQSFIFEFNDEGEYEAVETNDYGFQTDVPQGPLSNGSFLAYNERLPSVSVANLGFGDITGVTELGNIIDGGIFTASERTLVQDERVIVLEQTSGSNKILYYDTEGNLEDSLELSEQLFGLGELPNGDLFTTRLRRNFLDNVDTIQIVRFNEEDGVVDVYGNVSRFALLYGNFIGAAAGASDNGNICLKYSYFNGSAFVEEFSCVQPNGEVAYSTPLSSVGSPFSLDPMVADAAGNVYIAADNFGGARLQGYDPEGNLRYDVQIPLTDYLVYDIISINLNTAEDRLLLATEAFTENGAAALALEINTADGSIISEHLIHEEGVFDRTTHAVYQAGTNNILAFTSIFSGDEVDVDQSRALTFSVIDESGELTLERKLFEGFYEIPEIRAAAVDDNATIYGVGLRQNVARNALVSYLVGLDFEDVVSVKEADDLAKTAQLMIFPNPTANYARVQWDNTTNTDYTLELLANDGCTVTSWSGTLARGRANLEVNLTHLPGGPYLLRLTTEGGVSTQRVVKQ